MDAIEPPQGPASTMPRFDGVPESPASPVRVDADSSYRLSHLSRCPLGVTFTASQRHQMSLADVHCYFVFSSSGCDGGAKHYFL